MSKYNLTANTIKLIAILAMLFDHLVYVFTCVIPMVNSSSVIYQFLLIPGRITAPIICYLIAEGYHYTSNKRNYLKRLVILALVSHVPYVLLFNATWWKTTSIIWGLILGFIALSFYHRKDINTFTKNCLMTICLILSLVSTYDMLVVLWILFFGIYRNNFKKQAVAFVLITLLAGNSSIVFHLLNYGLHSWYVFGMLFSLPLIMMYNGKRGKSSILSKYGFYVFYPLHHLILYIMFFN